MVKKNSLSLSWVILIVIGIPLLRTPVLAMSLASLSLESRKASEPLALRRREGDDGIAMLVSAVSSSSDQLLIAVAESQSR